LGVGWTRIRLGRAAWNGVGLFACGGTAMEG
jgi:hypothetical protein